MDLRLTERPVLQGTGFVLLHGKDQVAIGYECIGEKAWSIRVSGAKFPMEIGQRFLSHGNRRYSDLTYVPTAKEARALANSVLSRKRKLRPIDAIFRTGVR